ncbi:MAG: nicotinamide mononucleotide transporter [Candidatus Zixiibacteriota bacterium]|nr:MAG: nicotinamide mononucleotide transporter [candidate division Zixibacteria bacterium]
MELLSQIRHYAFQYYGVDWAVTLMVFIGIFLLGDKKKAGFLLGMLSAALAFIFSFQIGSIANGVTALVLFILYFRGYWKWRKVERNPAG